MLDYEQAAEVLDELVDELPEEIFRGLNGGVSIIEDEKKSEDGRITLGTYFRGSMGMYIELYYGSFIALYGQMDDEQFRERLKNTLHHELTHHIESKAGERSLERWDDRQAELCGFNGIEVHSILFVCEDNTLSQIAESVFNSKKRGQSAFVSAYSAGINAASQFDSKMLKVCEQKGIRMPLREPIAVTEELLHEYDIALCMTLDQTDVLYGKCQELDERFMCLADDDIKPPTLPMRWKKCIDRLEDEVLAVIDELEQEV